MYGAILGDIIGNPYEFAQGNKNKKLPLLSPDSICTDNSVMTLVVADAFLTAASSAEDTDIRRQLIQPMQTYGGKFPYAGYGGKIRRWLAAGRSGNRPGSHHRLSISMRIYKICRVNGKCFLSHKHSGKRPKC